MPELLAAAVLSAISVLAVWAFTRLRRRWRTYRVGRELEDVRRAAYRERPRGRNA